MPDQNDPTPAPAPSLDALMAQGPTPDVQARKAQLAIEQAKIKVFEIEGREHIVQFFAFDHLPEPLREVSARFAQLAEFITTGLPRNPERTVALRKLLEAKDAAVRAKIAKD
jgi:hypothetical protein